MPARDRDNITNIARQRNTYKKQCCIQYLYDVTIHAYKYSQFAKLSVYRRFEISQSLLARIRSEDWLQIHSFLRKEE